MKLSFLSNERSANFYFGISDIVITHCELEDLANHRSAEGKVSRDCDIGWRNRGWNHETIEPYGVENILTNESLK